MKKLLAKLTSALRKQSNAFELKVKNNVTNEIVVHRCQSFTECQILIRQLQNKALYKMGDYTVQVSNIEGSLDSGEIEGPEANG